MSDNQFGAYHLADNPDQYEIQRDNNFEFIVTGIDNIKRADSDAVISNAQDVLKFSVVSASIPMFSQEPIQIRRGNSVIKAAGVPTFNDGQIVINDYIGADGKSVLMAWQNLSYDVRKETIGRMADYKKLCYLVERSIDCKIVRTWTLFGCWVQGLSESEFTNENSAKKTITATIAFDKAYMELPDVE